LNFLEDTAHHLSDNKVVVNTDIPPRRVASYTIVALGLVATARSNSLLATKPHWFIIILLWSAHCIMCLSSSVCSISVWTSIFVSSTCFNAYISYISMPLFSVVYVLKLWIYQYWTWNSGSDGAWMRWLIRELCCHLPEFRLFSLATVRCPVIMDQISISHQRLNSGISELQNL